MPPATLLVVDDDPMASKLLAQVLTQAGYSVVTDEDGRAALDRCLRAPPDLIISDLRMPRIDGVELLRELKGRGIPIPLVLMTASSTIESAVEAMREGAVDYLTKPLNIEELLIVVERALDGLRLRQESAALKSQLRELGRFDHIIGASAEMRDVFQRITQIAPSRATVLLNGETGTGKELVAAAIHHRSPRAAGPFVRLHCGALAESLLESELFGHERGSFTGAAKQRLGRFEQADGGTLFLDEIGEISAATQVKLLRVLQERELERVGGNQTVRVDVRVIAATNRDLRQMVADGAFREDLFYRLNVITLRVPPLRERSSDIPLLVEHFLQRFEAEDAKVVSVSPPAMDILTKYSWPGNVREVENVVHRAVVLTEGESIEPRHLPAELTQSAGVTDGMPRVPGASILDFERYAIMKTLEATGSTTKTAQLLGISIRKIQYRLQQYRDATHALPAPARRAAFRARR